jgi:hypothetical protein
VGASVLPERQQQQQQQHQSQRKDAGWATDCGNWDMARKAGQHMTRQGFTWRLACEWDAWENCMTAANFGSSHRLSPQIWQSFVSCIAPEQPA